MEKDVIHMNEQEQQWSYDQTLKLMALYREEWKHRDLDMMSILWRLVFISLVITFLPNLIGRIGIENSPLANNLPVIVYSVAGIVCALFGLYISVGGAKRIENIDKKYWDLMNNLPEDARIPRLEEDKSTKIFSIRLNNLFCAVPYCVVIILAISNILFHFAFPIQPSP